MRIADIHPLFRSMRFRKEIAEDLKPLKTLGANRKHLDIAKRGLAYFSQGEWGSIVLGLEILFRDTKKITPDHVANFINCIYDFKKLKLFNIENVISLARAQAKAINQNKSPNEIRKNFVNHWKAKG